MEYHLRLVSALCSDDVTLKASVIDEALAYCNTASPCEKAGFTPRPLEEPSYARRCRIVPPKDLPKRRRLHTPEGLAILLHSILHIEYSAIDLALDAAYRFGGMPREYYRDWLLVASDEVRHYRMLSRILEELGYAYGDFPVHRGLFDAALHTQGDLLERMAVIPRHYEATGLDVNPRIVAKLASHRGVAAVDQVLEALEVIYREEIEHVRKGDRWFRYLCAQRGLATEETFLEILERFGLRDTTRGFLNVEGRKEAGFACSELRAMGASEC